jgi:hypothetical protein
MTRALTRSGCQAEKDMALWPPIEWPTSAARRQPKASNTPSRSDAKFSVAYAGGWAHWLSPCPR